MKKKDIKNKVLSEIFKKDKKIEDLLKRVKIMREEFTKEMISYGMTDMIIKKVLEGKDISICSNCNTPNMYESFYDRVNDIHMYRCDNCNTIS